MTRAKNTLVITSSYPKPDLEKYFDPTTFQLHNHQTLSIKPFKQLKDIRGNRNFSIQKYSKSAIDSISLYIPFKKAPFPKYVNGEKQKYGIMKFEINEYHGIPIAVKQHKKYKAYVFELNDTNLLKKNGYTDKQIIQFLTNYVEGYFDNRVKRIDIVLQRIDLCRYFYSDQLDHFYKEIEEKYKSIDYQGFEVGEIKEGIERSAVYTNFWKNREYVLKIYKPCRKENNNKIFNNDIVKVEVKMGRKKLISQFIEENNVENIIKVCDENYFEKIMDNVFKKRKVKSWGCLASTE